MLQALCSLLGTSLIGVAIVVLESAGADLSTLTQWPRLVPDFCADSSRQVHPLLGFRLAIACRLHKVALLEKKTKQQLDHGWPESITAP